ncbi:MAG: DUF1638 domain-containing protein [Anaerolineales bacterium]|nr:DUF1638 domain-containing protein [Anaerolineales bacterium]
MAYSNPLGIPAERTLVLACATVIEEMQAWLPPEMRRQVLEFGLHSRPANLTGALQAAIDAAGDDIDLILLGYGMCSRGAVGLTSPRATLVIPRTDDCIAIFLGSRSAYRQQAESELGTYYLTKGWIAVGDTPFSDFDRMVERYGEAKAVELMKMLLEHYTRLALINTGTQDLDRYREYAQRTAERFGLRYEEIVGAPALVKKLIFGPWDDEVVVCPPGSALRDDHFIQLED